MQIVVRAKHRRQTSCANRSEYVETIKSREYANSLVQVVAPEWLEECLAQGKKIGEEKHRIHLEFCCDSGDAYTHWRVSALQT